MVWRNCHKDVLPFIALVATQAAIVGLNTLFKAASLQGLSYYVFTAYIYAINTLVLLPISFFFCSKTEIPSPMFPLFWRICLLGVLCVSGTIIGMKAIAYSSPTLSSAMGNLIPPFTFLLAIIFRMEKPALRSSSFRAKLIGTAVSISGALVVVLYKGPTILQMSKPPISLHWLSVESSQSNWVTGALLMVAEGLIFSLWFIIMTDVMKIYPAELVVSFFNNLCVAILSIIVGFVAEPNLSAWRPTSEVALMAFIYSGFFGTAFHSVVYSWSLHLKGPVYVAAFKPLGIVIAVVVGVIFLGDALHLGGVIGAFILSAGVYAVIWGNAMEEKMTNAQDSSSLETPSSGRIPLLQSEQGQDV